MSPQCSTKRSAALGSFPVFSVISVITEISEGAEGKSSAKSNSREPLGIAKGYDNGSPISCHSQAIGTDWSRPGRTRPRPKPRAFRQRFMQHQHLADGLGSDETHEPSVAVDHGDGGRRFFLRSEEHTPEIQYRLQLVFPLLLEKKNHE